MIFLFFAITLFLGGILGLYYSIRSLMKKKSSAFSLPNLWLYGLFYLVVTGTGLALHASGDDLNIPVFTTILLMLAALLPGLLYLAWSAFRLHTTTPRITIRRAVLALISGSTLITILVFIVDILLFFTVAKSALPPACTVPTSLVYCTATQDVMPIAILLLILFAVTDELLKSTVLTLLMRKVDTLSEAFLLGLACGIGLGITETVLVSCVLYINLLTNWLAIALLGSSLILLQGFCGALTSMGWFYLIHTKHRRMRKAGWLWMAALFLHGVFWLLLLSTPLLELSGISIQSVQWDTGFTIISALGVICLVGFLLGLAVFLFVVERLRIATVRVSAPASQ